MSTAVDHNSSAAAPLSLGERDLAEVLSAFNDATQKLHATHESLRAEVARLQGELTSATEQLNRSRRLAALGEMAAGIAHEVRNPLGCIRLYARMLMDDLTDRPSERGIAEKIASATRGLDAVVSDVLAFAREMRLRPEVISPWSLIDKAVDEALAADSAETAHLVSARIRVVRESTAQSADTITCDPALVHRALVNIIRNAVQAMRDAAGSSPDRPCVLGLNTRRVRLPDAARPLAPDVEYLAIVIRDTGPGIPESVMERMFNPFFTTRAAGTGLGLAIVHRILDAHGGRILVSNVAGTDDTQQPPHPHATGAVVELLLPTQLLPHSTIEPRTPMQGLNNSFGQDGRRAHPHPTLTRSADLPLVGVGGQPQSDHGGRST
ncbi:MAG: hypothetical protein K2W85_00120 [Phycisphaerales bacterium]|nr:hypothetical protein [Phycisphaerales bacterium]